MCSLQPNDLIAHEGGRMHEVAGYAALAAALLRLLPGRVGPADARFAAFVRGPLVAAVPLHLQGVWHASLAHPEHWPRPWGMAASPRSGRISA